MPIGSSQALRLKMLAAPQPYSSSLPVSLPTEVGPLSNGDGPLSVPKLDKIYRTGVRGTMDRVGDNIHDFVNSDQGRAALMRSAAATLNGGIGAGIKAGADYVDQEKDDAAKQAQLTTENELKSRGLDITQLSDQQRFDLGLMDAASKSDQNRETSRHNRNTEYVDADGNAVRREAIRSQEYTTVRGQNVDRANNIDNNSTSRANNEGTVGASIYGSNTDYLGRVNSAAGIGSKGAGALPYTQTEIEQPAHTEGGFMGFGGNPVPKSKTVTHIPLAPGAPGIVAPTVQPGKADIDALKGNPRLQPDFDRKFGAGSSSQYLGGR